MKNEEILKKAISKAVKNGWDDGQFILDEWDNIEVHIAIAKNKFFPIIFDKDFAKAFFGERKIEILDYPFDENPKKEDYPVITCTDPGTDLWIGFNWQYCLQQMVLSKDPIKYLEKFLK